MTKTQAIKQARANVTMHRFGDGWQVNTYDEGMKAWWQGVPTDYGRALTQATEAKLSAALNALGVDADDAFDILRDYDENGGDWTSYVPAPKK